MRIPKGGLIASLFIAPLALFLAACGPSIVVDRDPTAALPGPATYAWSEDIPGDKASAEKLPGADNPRVNNDIIHGMVQRALDVGLAKRGYNPAPREKAAWLLHYHVALQRKTELVQEPIMRPVPRLCFHRHDCDDWPWGWYGPPEYYTRKVSYHEGALLVDLHDARTGKLVWRGLMTDEVNANKPLEPASLQKAVDEMLKQLPGPMDPPKP